MVLHEKRTTFYFGSAAISHWDREAQTMSLLDFGLWNLALGLWALDFGLWTLAFGIWAFGLWALGFRASDPAHI